MILTQEEIESLGKDIRRALHENYVLKPEGETDEDCQVHDIIATFYRFCQYNCERK